MIDKTTPKRKRTPRKRHELPDPNKPPQADVNNRLKRVNSRVTEEHLDLFNQVSKLYPTKRKALEAAIELLAEKKLLPKSPDIIDDTPSAP